MSIKKTFTLLCLTLLCNQLQAAETQHQISALDGLAQRAKKGPQTACESDKTLSQINREKFELYMLEKEASEAKSTDQEQQGEQSKREKTKQKQARRVRKPKYQKSGQFINNIKRPRTRRPDFNPNNGKQGPLVTTPVLNFMLLVGAAYNGK